MNEFQLHNPYHVAVIRTEATKTISKFIPDIVEETQLSTGETFSPNGRGTEVIFFAILLLTLRSGDANQSIRHHDPSHCTYQ